MKKIYLFLILITLIGCEKEEFNIPNEEPNTTSEIQNQFSLSKYEDNFVKNHLQVNWHNISEAEKHDEFHEFSTNLNSTLQKEGNSIYYKYTVTAKKSGNNDWDFRIVKFTAVEKSDLENISLKILGKFTGTIHQYNFAGVLMEIEGVHDGKVISTYK